MFKKETVHDGDEIETVIGPSVQVEGNFVANGDIIIEGIVSGSIKTEKNLRVGPNAKIFANISADNALIAGEVQGNVKVRGSLELAGTAKIFGDVKTSSITIESGACLHGKCNAGPEKKSKLEKPEDIAKAKAAKEKEPEESTATKVK